MWLKIIFKIPTLLISTFNKPFYRKKGYFALIITFVLLLIWFGIRYYFDSGWDNPQEYSQLERIDNLFGCERQYLYIKLGHFGNNIEQDRLPYTRIISFGNERWIDAKEFSEKYFNFEPDSIPKNNPSIVLRAIHDSISVTETFEKLVENKLVKKFATATLNPTYNQIKLKMKLEGSGREFSRTYNFRTQSQIETVWLWSTLGCFLIFLILILNIPAWFPTIREDKKYQFLFKQVFIIITRIIKLASILGVPLAGITGAIIDIIGAMIKIFEKFGRKNDPDKVALLRSKLRDAEKILRREKPLSHDEVQVVIEILVFIYKSITIIEYRIIKVTKSREDFDELINELEAARKQIEEKKKPLEAKEQELLRELNELRSRLREEHENKFKIKFDDAIADIDRLFKDEIFRKGVDHLFDAWEELRRQSADIQFMPEGKKKEGVSVLFNLKSLNSKLALRMTRKEHKIRIETVKPTEIKIDAESQTKEINKINYLLMLKPMLIYEKEKMHAIPEPEIEFKLQDSEQLEELYKQLDIDDIDVHEF